MPLRRSTLFHSIVSHFQFASFGTNVPTFVYIVCCKPGCRYCSYASKSLGDMTTPSSKVLSSSASKRARSQDSRRSLNSSPAIKIPRTGEAPDNTNIPAFLRQTNAGTPLCMSKLHATRSTCTKRQQRSTKSLKTWNGNSNFA